MMGLSERTYYFSNFVVFLILDAITAGICTLILAFNVLNYCNVGLIFLFFILFGLATFGYIVFMTSIFNSVRQATLVTTLIYVLTYCAEFAVSDSISYGIRVFASVVPNLAMCFTAKIIIYF